MNEKDISLKKNMIWNFFGNFIYMATQWLMTILVVRISGYAVSGEFALAISVTNIFYAVAVFGVRNYQVSDIENEFSDLDYFKLRVLTNTFSLVLCLIFSWINKYSMHQCIVILIYMLFKLIESFTDVFHGMIQKEWRLDIIGQSFTLKSIFNICIFTIILYISDNLIFAICGMVITSLFIMLIYDVIKGNCIAMICKKTEDKSQMWSLLYAVAPFAVYYSLINVLGSIPRWALERVWGGELLGYYAALATPTAIIQVMASYIFSPLIPLFARYYHDCNLQKFKELFKKTIMGVAGIAISCFIGAFLFGKIGLRILYGKEILKFYHEFFLLIVCAVFTAFNMFLGSILTVFRDFKSLIVSNVVGCMVSLLICYFFIPSLGMKGANIAWGLSLFISMIIMISGVIRESKKIFEKRNDLLEEY